MKHSKNAPAALGLKKQKDWNLSAWPYFAAGIRFRSVLTGATLLLWNS
jgi:hypothetical protein